MNDTSYQKVKEAYVKWTPSKRYPVFHATAIKSIIHCGFLEAVAIAKRLHSENQDENLSNLNDNAVSDKEFASEEETRIDQLTLF